MPPVSEKQRRAMHAAAAGHDARHPEKVGQEFAESDPGGKLPAQKGQREAKQPLKSGAEKTAKKAKRRADVAVDYGAMVTTARNYAR